MGAAGAHAALSAGRWVWAQRLGVCAAVCVSLLSCGGGGGGTLSSSSSASSGSGSGTTTTSASNVASVVADSGPVNNTVNTLYTSVTVCVPGSTTNCQTIDNIQVDTGSVGLRILASALTLTLPVQPAAVGNSLVECTVFADGYSWGPVALVDMQIAGESASNLPVQLIGDSRFPTIPADCSASPGTEQDTVSAFGANGILGIGVFKQDCGSDCSNTVEPAAYYGCSSTQCVGTMVPLADQVQNPVTLFATDNNGTIIDLPTVAEEGAATLTGSLIFGIDTQSNNASGTETVLTVDPNSGYLTASFNGEPAALSQSFIDSGSNGIYFTDSDIPECTDTNYSGFYCPATSLALTVTLTGLNSVSSTVDFTVDNAETLGTDNPTFTVFPTLAGTNPVAQSFDFGLPFYFGRRVATALENDTTSAGTGPYVAF
jgi:hypothetical protein